MCPLEAAVPHKQETEGMQQLHICCQLEKLRREASRRMENFGQVLQGTRQLARAQVYEVTLEFKSMNKA